MNQEEVRTGATVKMNGTLAVFGEACSGSRASTSTEPRRHGREVSLPWELYCLAVIVLIACIGGWEAISWFFEWVALRRSGSVEESRGARRLRRLQQAGAGGGREVRFG